MILATLRRMLPTHQLARVGAAVPRARPLAAGCAGPWVAALLALAAHAGARRNGYAFDDAALVAHDLRAEHRRGD